MKSDKATTGEEKKGCCLCGCSPCKCLKKVVLPIVAGFAFIFFYEYLVHGVLLKPYYDATASLWRSPEGMMKHFPLMVVIEFLSAIVLFKIYKKGFSMKPKGWLCFGVGLGLLQGLTMLNFFVFEPLPLVIPAAWFTAKFFEMFLLGGIFGALSGCCAKDGAACGTDGKTGGCG